MYILGTVLKTFGNGFIAIGDFMTGAKHVPLKCKSLAVMVFA